MGVGMKFKKLFTKIVLIAAISGVLAPMAEAGKYWRMVNRKTNAINSAISNLQKKASELGIGAIEAEFKGVYGVVGRKNDIFVFCDKGMNEPPEMHFWKSVNPLTGQFQVTNWYNVNWTYIPYFVVLCPYGKKRGSWNGPGEGSMYKANPSHNSDIPGSQPVVPFIH